MKDNGFRYEIVYAFFDDGKTFLNVNFSVFFIEDQHYI